jgi:hypothetical protein
LLSGFSGHRRRSQHCRRSSSSATDPVTGFWFCHPHTRHTLCVHFFKLHRCEGGKPSFTGRWVHVGFTTPPGARPITGNNHLLYHLLITIGLFGLIASFHGLILAAGRSTYEFGKVKYAPQFWGIYIQSLKHRRTL